MAGCGCEFGNGLSMVALSRFGAEIRYHVASGTHSWPRPPWTREGQVDAPSMVKHVVALLAFRAQDTLRTLLTLLHNAYLSSHSPDPLTCPLFCSCLIPQFANLTPRRHHRPTPSWSAYEKSPGRPVSPGRQAPRSLLLPLEPRPGLWTPTFQMKHNWSSGSSSWTTPSRAWSSSPLLP